VRELWYPPLRGRMIGAKRFVFEGANKPPDSGSRNLVRKLGAKASPSEPFLLPQDSSTAGTASFVTINQFRVRLDLLKTKERATRINSLRANDVLESLQWAFLRRRQSKCKQGSNVKIITQNLKFLLKNLFFRIQVCKFYLKNL